MVIVAISFFVHGGTALLTIFDDQHIVTRKRLLSLANALKEAAEPGFEETTTVSLWRDFLSEHQIPISWAIDGHSPVVDVGLFGHAKKSVVVTADLDAVGMITGEGWVCEHTCGHYAQSVHALGLALLLHTYGGLEDVAVRIIGCPGEECRPVYDIDYPLPFIPGKQRLLEDGWFNGADAVLSTHLADHLSAGWVQMVDGAEGMVGLRLRMPSFVPDDYRPLSMRTYAGFLEEWQKEIRRITGSPQLKVRARPIRTGIELWTGFPRELASTQMNAVNDILSQLASHTIVEVELISSYAPLHQSSWLQEIAESVLKKEEAPIHIHHLPELPGSTDLGNVSQAYPVFQLFIGGTSGVTHERDFRVVDEQFALLWPIQWLMNMIQELAVN